MFSKYVQNRISLLHTYMDIYSISKADIYMFSNTGRVMDFKRIFQNKYPQYIPQWISHRNIILNIPWRVILRTANEYPLRTWTSSGYSGYKMYVPSISCAIWVMGSGQWRLELSVAGIKGDLLDDALITATLLASIFCIYRYGSSLYS